MRRPAGRRCRCDQFRVSSNEQPAVTLQFARGRARSPDKHERGARTADDGDVNAFALTYKSRRLRDLLSLSRSLQRTALEREG